MLNKLVSSASGVKGQQICLAIPPKVMRDCLLQSTCLERHISLTVSMLTACEQATTLQSLLQQQGRYALNS